LGKLKEPESFRDFTRKIKDRLGISGFKWLCKEDIKVDSKKIRKVAVVCGSGNSIARRLADIDYDLVIVGEIGYHNALQIIESGKILVAIGHGSSEKLATVDMCNKLEDFFQKQKIKIDILKSRLGYKSWRYQVD